MLEKDGYGSLPPLPQPPQTSEPAPIVDVEQLAGLVRQQQAELESLRQQLSDCGDRIKEIQANEAKRLYVDDVDALWGEVADVRREVGACRREMGAGREEFNAICECLMDDGLLSSVKLLAKLSRRRCLDGTMHTYDIGLAVGLLMGPAALRKMGTASKSLRRATDVVWPPVRSLCLSYIFVCGGRSQNVSTSLSLGHVERYSPLTGTWEAVTPMRQRREGSSAGVLEGKLYVCGGFNGEATMQSVECLNLLEMISKKDIQWQSVAPMLACREGACNGVVSGRLYVCGGSNGRGQHFCSSERYDPSTDAWEEFSSMTERRAWTTAGVLGAKLYVCGGYDGHKLLSSAERFDVVKGCWEAISPMLERRSGASASTVAGKLYVCGGGFAGGALRSAERYDPMAGQWECVRPMTAGRCHAACASVAGRLYVFGGYTGTERGASAEVFSPATGVWTLLPPMIERRSRAAVAQFVG
eukprot:TRINITY_DN90923_c0_g1_i1.p1 TRINITY_DN90923_c0_g1~~TRINITY_DN90923_c0_g1_i1.p1  ORF type:complete len:471 (-),score=97.60 TRINITY_DN90923_c0_g1_i1:428-1840(-)